MTHTELVAELAARNGMTKKQAREAIDTLADITARQLRARGDVKINGLGTFKAKHRKARTARNPQTGEAMKVPAKWTVTCSVAKALKDAV